MWLLNAETFELIHFANERQKPDYVILSHTWTDEEVTFQDMKQGFHSGFDHVRHKSGWKKIEGTCRLAKQHYPSTGSDCFVWIDTCCIDKSSSTELQEAINSMFRWYQYAKACFVYLSDVPTGQDPADESSAFRKSRWFTRGWTLQELLAPGKVIFFDEAWHLIGCKHKFRRLVHDITGIRDIFIASDPWRQDTGNGAPVSRASVAERLSWAASRETTIEEDIAYCLLGMFDIHMPMLYGEGSKAFVRLQEEIMKLSDDNSILCWGLKQPIGEIDGPSHGTPILAPHPLDFKTCRGISPRAFEGFDVPSFSMTQRGLRIRLPVRADLSHNKVVYGILACGVEDSLRSMPSSVQTLVAIPLISTSAICRERSSYLARELPQKGEYFKPFWCRPGFVSKDFLKQAHVMDLLIRRPMWDDIQIGQQLPFALAMAPIPSQAFDVLGVYPPQPIRAQFFTYGDLTSSQKPSWTTKSKCPKMLAPNESSREAEWTGNAEEGQRMIHMKLRGGGLLLVLDYQGVRGRGFPDLFFDHQLSCQAFDMPFAFSWENLHTLAITQDFTQYKKLDMIKPPKSKDRESKRSMYRMAADSNMFVQVDLRRIGGSGITDVIIDVFERSNGRLHHLMLLEDGRLMP